MYGWFKVIKMNDTLIIIAGVIGVSVAIVHGVLLQKLMIKPLLQSTYGKEMPASSQKLIPLLLHFSTIFWFVGGVLLIASPFMFNQEQGLMISLGVCSFYIVGAIGNFWGTNGKHPGWVLLAISVLLIVFGL